MEHDGPDPLAARRRVLITGAGGQLGHALVRAFAVALGAAMDRPVHLQDERLTSREAESLLALREKDWRARKKRLDAAAAALILQDYLDAMARSSAATLMTDPDL